MAGVVNGSEPPLAEESLGRVMEEDGHEVEYYRSVVWEGLRYQLGDSVSIRLDQRNEKGEHERSLGEIIHLWKGKAPWDNSSSSEMILAEVRYFNEFWQLPDQCMEGVRAEQIMETDALVVLSVTRFNHKVGIYPSESRWLKSPDDEEAYWCQYHYTDKNGGMMTKVVSAGKSCASSRRDRALEYSRRVGPRETLVEDSMESSRRSTRKRTDTSRQLNRRVRVKVEVEEETGKIPSNSNAMDVEPPKTVIDVDCAHAESILGYVQETGEDGNVHQVEYYDAVVWQGETFKLGDYVSIKKFVPGKDNERDLGQIIHLWKGGDTDADEGQEEEVLAEVRFFKERWELPLKNKNDHSDAEIMEGEDVAVVPVATFNHKVMVYFSEKTWQQSSEDQEAYWCCRHFTGTNRACTITDVDRDPFTTVKKQRWQRALQYSKRSAPQGEEVDVPPRGEGSFGCVQEEEDFDVHRVEYYQSVIWKGENFEVGDCVSVQQDLRLKGREKNERFLGEIIHLWRRRADEGDEEEEEENEKYHEMMAEIRLFMEPWEVPHRCEGGEILETDRVNIVPVVAINYKVDVFFSRSEYDHSDPDLEAYWCRRHYSVKGSGTIFNVVSGPVDQYKLRRRQRASRYSIRQGPGKTEEDEDKEEDPMVVEDVTEEGEGEEPMADGGGVSRKTKRAESLSESSKDPLLEAQNRLQLSAAPPGGFLPGRVQDVANIKTFIKMKIRPDGSREENSDRPDVLTVRGNVVIGIVSW